MPELVEQMYCSQQIVIPPKFPYILKRYCKAAIKTQPYDLLRWSFEYFKALAHKRPPPVKLRLEYPVYSTEGGLTRGCLKVLANQLAGMQMVPLDICKAAWRGFCLDPEELRRIFCLCEVYKRAEYVSFLQFIAVAGGMLTKSLTHTMILLCETLTKEPDGGSAAIPVHDFLIMYRFLARMDASADMKYVNGFREGWKLPVSEEIEEEEILKMDEITDVERLKQLSVAKFGSSDVHVAQEGMVAGRQMSITSGEFIVAHIEKEILEYIDDQIAILPDPDLKKKKAKPEEVAMIRELLETFLDENMDIIVPELEEVEEEEEPIPDITVIYAVPGIGGPVDEETIRVFEEYAQEACKVQADVFMPRNIRHFMCPPLEKYEEYVYEDLGPKTKKESLQQREEVPVVGKMTD
ncbi:ropporin-1-like [Pectinophora gossypiella]|uniref:ropporin-1-like n=1 Tax=Pectinophora gossypiella TaxID=13191 RepID=UPI00214EFAD5|nr:ropporin-1-like [Pectinophora gossypiella]XP_049880758.1 ropporin-1-like [Pectinophora gossypiella]XP_049880759.1 ropporin-1-like [Pectinophora gossypiella]XP_049880760.1 ropporin-1-like [Pectinophora gossypiella]